MSNLTYSNDGLRTLSYSLLEDLEACPRKYQLYNVVGAKGNEHDRRSIDFAFGHAVGSGVQAALMGCALEDCYYECIVNYSASSFIQLDGRIKKKLTHAMIAVREFYSIAQMILVQYEVADIVVDGISIMGVEPEFSIQFSKDASYNGHIDVLLLHKVSRQPKVIEIKTTVLTTVHPSVYSNSNQVKGYALAVKYLQWKGIIADSDRVDVEYHVYKTGKGEWEAPLIFGYNNIHIVGYIRDIETKLKVMDLYDSMGNYPMNGSACNNFFRACEFYNTCHWPEERFAKGERFNKTESNIFKVGLEEYKEFFEWLTSSIITMEPVEENYVSEEVNESDFLQL